jgi:uncharacterized phage-associated protein
MKAIETAKHLLSRVNKERFEEVGDGISNLKLQKLLYFIQKTNYSVYHEPFFEDVIEAWQYGPVVPNIYHHFKEYGRHDIDIFKISDFIKDKELLSARQIGIIDFVWDAYYQYSGGALIDISHQDQCWIDNVASSGIITLEELKCSATRDEFLKYESILDEL